MNFINERLLMEEHQHIQTSLEQRKQALILQLHFVNDPEKDYALIHELLNVQNKSKISRSHSLLECQSSKLMQKQIKMEIERFEKRVNELRCLLASKEQEITYQKENGKSMRKQRPNVQNFMNLNHENKLKQQLYQQFKARSILQDQILQVQKILKNQQVIKQQRCYRTQQLDTTLIKLVVKEVEHTKLLKQQFAQNQQKLQFEKLRFQSALLRYKELSNRLMTEKSTKIEREEVQKGLISAKNISQTSDED